MGAAPHRVSVIIPTKDRCAMLAQALASVRALEGNDLQLEVIVADNGSSDDTRAVAAQYGARVIDAVGAGAAIARNAGLRAATGEFVAFLDDDDAWQPGHLRPQLRLLDERPDFSAAIGQTTPADIDLRPVYPPWPKTMPDDGDFFAAFLAGFMQIGATVARTSVRDTVGYFDETLLGDQDWDWHLRLALAHKIGFVPVPAVLFRQRPPGTGEDLMWRRLKYFRRVFRTNLRRAGKRRPPWRFILRAYLNNLGLLQWTFIESAYAHLERNERGATVRAVWRATRVSPLHALADVLRPRSYIRPLIVGALLGRRATPSAAA